MKTCSPHLGSSVILLFLYHFGMPTVLLLLCTCYCTEIHTVFLLWMIILYLPIILYTFENNYCYPFLFYLPIILLK